MTGQISLSLMERLYNPDLMSEAEIKQTFVARQPLIDELMSLIEKQPQGAGVQHAVVVAPRGMGKTTTLLMVQFALTDRGLNDKWQAVRFPEESYGVSDLADFWLETLRNLAVAVDMPALAEQAETLTGKFPRNADLQEAALAVIKEWCRHENKRLLLLVDNFDQILEQIGSERDNAALRNELMNGGTLQIIGGATTFFHEARSYDQPLYNFFRLYHLEELSFEEMQNLLRQRAAADGTPNFEAILQANTTRLRVLRYFTGGNPRLVLMLYRVVMDSQVVEVREALEKLLDEVTPYYKAKIDALPPQQRKILDHIARISSQTNEGLTPGEIAQATRLSPQAVSSQLRRLGLLGYVRAANLRERNSYYTLSEPLYAIWHQMRFGRGPRRRVQWLVDFLKSWYDADELQGESQRLEDRFRNFFQTGAVQEARSALQHRLYIAHAMSDEIAQINTVEGVVSGFLELKDVKALKEALSEIQLDKLSSATLNKLFEANCISAEQKNVDVSSLDLNREQEMLALVRLFQSSFENENYTESLNLSNQAIDLYINEDAPVEIIGIRGLTYLKLNQPEKSIADFKTVLEVYPENVDALHSLGNALRDTENHIEAEKIFFQAQNIEPKHSIYIWSERARSLMELDRYEEAVLDLNVAIKMVKKSDPPYFSILWYFRGQSLFYAKKYKKSLADFKRYSSVNPDENAPWYCQAVCAIAISDFSLALDCINRAVETSDSVEDSETYYSFAALKFSILVANDKLKEAETTLRELTKQGQQSLSWQDDVGRGLEMLAASGSARITRDLIAETGTEEIFFPLARALDYLFTGDEALVEKLSPEVRNLVLEMVEKLRPSVGDAAAQPAPKARPRSAPRQRIRKQLR